MRAVASASVVLNLDEFAPADVISEYLSALKVAGRSPKTISWYADMLWEFLRFLERDGGTGTVADLAPSRCGAGCSRSKRDAREASLRAAWPPVSGP